MQKHIYFDSTIGYGWHSMRHRRRMNLRSHPRSTVRRWNTVWLFDVLLTDWIENGFHGTDISARPHPYSGNDCTNRRTWETRYIIFFLLSLFLSLFPPITLSLFSLTFTPHRNFFSLPSLFPSHASSLPPFALLYI